MTESILNVENPTQSVVEQNIEVKAIGGNSFGPGQTIEVHVPADIGFINPAESYLSFDVEHSGNCYSMCNALTGGHGYIDQLYIRSLNSGETLESIDNYNFLVQNTLWRTRHEEDHRNLQDLAMGCESADFSAGAYLMDELQPFYRLDGTKARGAGQITGQKVKMNLNLMSGVLGNIGRNQVCPLLILGGVNVVINLASVEQSAFMMSSTVQTTTTNPTRTAGDLVLPTEILGDDFTQSGTSWSHITLSSFTNSASDYNSMSKLPLKVGQHIDVHYKVGGVSQTAHETTLKSVSRDDAGAYETLLELNTPITLVDGDVVSDIQVKARMDGGSAPSWTISNVKMVLQQVSPNKQQMAQFNKGISEGQSKTWRYYSVTNYKQVVNSSQTQASIRIPVINNRCLSLFSVPQDLDNVDNNRFYGFNNNGEDGEKEYQYRIKTRLTPDRKVPCARDDIELKNGKYKIWQREVEKCLNVAGLDVERLDSSVLFSSQQGKSAPFCIGRAVGMLRATSDLSNTDPTLNINYSSKSKNQLYHTFVFHTRTANFSKNGLVVEY